MEKMKMEKIRLSAEGVWFHDDVEITHQRTIDLMFKSIFLKNGDYFLSGEKKPVPVIVDDAAFFVRDISEKNGEFVIKISDATEEKLNVATLDVGSDNQLYCLIKSASVKAKFERKVYYELMKNLDQRDGYYGLVLKNRFYPVQSVSQNQKENGVAIPIKKAAKKIRSKKILKRSKKKSKKKNHGKSRKK